MASSMLTKTPNLNSGINDLIWACVLNDYVTEEDEKEFTEMVGAQRLNILQVPCAAVPCAPDELPQVDPRDVKSRGGPQYEARRRSHGTPGIYSDVSSHDTPPLLWLSLEDDNSHDAIQPRGRTFKQTWLQQLKRADRKRELSANQEKTTSQSPRGRSRQPTASTRPSRSFSSRGASRSRGGESNGDESVPVSQTTGESRARSRITPANLSRRGVESTPAVKKTRKARSRSIGRRLRSTSKGRRKEGKDSNRLGHSWFGRGREESRNDIHQRSRSIRRSSTNGRQGGPRPLSDDWEPPQQFNRASSRKGSVPGIPPQGSKNKKLTPASSTVRQSSGPVIRRFEEY